MGNDDKVNKIKVSGEKGEKGEKGIPSGYEKLWDKLVGDLGVTNIILIFFGSILLIFSPDNGWQFDLPCVNYTLAYRGWLGILCFIIVIINKYTKKQKKLSEIKHNEMTVKNGTPIKSMYVQFPNDKISNLSSMSSQLFLCNDYAAAMLLLVNFQKVFNGKLYFSPFPQVFAEKKKISTKGDGDKEWCWWYWDGGNVGFQLVVSLCQ